MIAIKFEEITAGEMGIHDKIRIYIEDGPKVLESIIMKHEIDALKDWLSDSYRKSSITLLVPEKILSGVRCLKY
jgi:hypothetical protein